MRSDRAAKQQQTQAEAMAGGELGRLFTEEEMLNASYAAGYENARLAKGTYQERSPLMRLDPNHVSKAEATVAVIAEDQERSCDIAGVYKDIVESGELAAKVAEDAGMETLGVSELLYLDRTAERMSISMASNDNKTGTFSMSIVRDEESDIFKITAVYDDGAKCQAMLDSAVAFIMEKQPGIEAALGEHELYVVNESFGVVSDMEIADLQKAVLSDIAVMKKGVSDAKKELSDKELQYYELLKSGAAKADQEESSSAVPAPGISVKYVLLGALMAAFVYAFILLLVYIFNTKIRATDSLQDLYGLPQLGMIPAGAGKKKALGAVDKWIVSLRDRNKRQFTPEEALELAAVAAKMAAGKEALQDVCLMGCGMKERAIGICEKIKVRLEEEGIHTAILNNVLYDARMLGELEGAKGVVLVESAGSTLYTETAEELELLKRQGIKALGGILVG